LGGSELVVWEKKSSGNLQMRQVSGNTKIAGAKIRRGALVKGGGKGKPLRGG